MGWLLLTAITARALTNVPTNISQDANDPSNRVVVSWETTPGRTYNIFTTDGLPAMWTPTNFNPMRARSTRASATNAADRASRFYRAVEQPVPAGNTGAINATTVAETEKLLGLTFTATERNQMLQLLNAGFQDANRLTYEAMRQHRLLNRDVSALVFDPLPAHFVFESVQQPVEWSPPQQVAVPGRFADLAFYSVRDLGELIRTRQLSSMDLTRLCLERLKRYDSNLYCVITLTEELALEQAARADAELAAGQYRGPLHGIPYGLKDLFSTRRYPTTWGAAPFRDQVINEDAFVVRRLEQAGAVLVAKLTLGSLALGDVWFGGTTRNPWNLAEGSSGSSAGSAAAVAAGLVPFAIGTETLGSIVSPSTRCRVTGLRPTFGRVSRTGAMNLCWSMDKIGPIARSVEDCAIVFDALRGADGLDRAAFDSPFNYVAAPALARLRVGYRGVLPSEVTNRLAALVGPERLVPITLPDYPIQGMAWVILSVESAAVFDELTRFGADDFLNGQGRDDWPNIFRTGRTVPAVEYLQADRLRKKLIEDMAALMKTVDVFVAPNTDGESVYVSNLTGQPCVVIPHGGSTSLSFIGKPHDEATVLALAKAYQNLTSFHQGRPPLFVP
jgi:Asp-tRNA(Asn)/Glu-tRNA(Gln) amidotransferase A subunit family amidase